MENNDKLKETNIKNRTCYYFHDIIKIEYFEINNILLDNKSYGIILIIIKYHNLVQNFDCGKPLRISFDKEDGFIRVRIGLDILSYKSKKWCYTSFFSLLFASRKNIDFAIMLIKSFFFLFFM